MLRTYLEHLRAQPEAVRVRYVSLATVASGGFLLLVWATLLLPAQLRWGPGGGSDAPAVAGVAEVAEATPSPTSEPTPAAKQPLPLSD